MTNEQLQKFIPIEGDLLAVRAAVDKWLKRQTCIENLQDKMERKRKNRKAKQTHSNPDPSKNATKFTRMVEFYWSHYESTLGDYKSVGKAHYGGVYPKEVPKNLKKEDLIAEAKKRYFEEGISTKGSINDCVFDMSYDAKGRKLLSNPNETIEEIIIRTGMNNPRFYLLSKSKVSNTLSDSDTELPSMVSSPGVSSKRRKTADSSQLQELNFSEPSTSEHEICQKKDQEGSFQGQLMQNSLLLVQMSDNVPDGSGESMQIPTCGGEFIILSDGSDYIQSGSENNPFPGTNMESEKVARPGDGEIILPSAEAGESSQMISTAIHVSCGNDVTQSDNSNGLEENVEQNQQLVETDELPVMVNEIEVWYEVKRGHIFEDLKDFMISINFDPNVSTLRIKVKDERGEDSGGVLRDALTEFWETFNMQYTEGFESKVPITVHTMQYEDWIAIAKIIVVGYKQEQYLPIDISMVFFQNCISGDVSEELLVYEFLQKFVAPVEKEKLEMALKDIESVDKEELLDIISQYGVRVDVTQSNVQRVITEVSHHVFVQHMLLKHGLTY